MLNRQKISRDLNKIQKLWAERGANTVVSKIFHLSTKKMSQPAIKRTLDRKNSLLKNLNMGDLLRDIEQVFSFGLLRSLSEIRSDVRSIPTEFSELITDEAERILKHEFTIYGNLKVSYEPDCFSWTADPLTGFVWPLSFTPYKCRIKKPYRTDIKTIWEIARFQFLSPLAYAYILTGDKRYARFAAAKVNSWIEENPFLNGPHWFTPMESSIRLINWSVYFPLLEIFMFTDLSCKNRIIQSILEHLIYIRENLETSPSFAGNHYLADLLGLLLAELLFPSQKWAVECTKFARKEFDKEVQSQFTESGINFEGSLPYHRLSSEICLMGLALIKKNGIGDSLRAVDRLRKASEFTKFYDSVGDRLPLIGDNDSGICVRFFSGQESNRHGYLCCLFDSILEDNCRPKNFDDYLCCTHFSRTDHPDSSRRDTFKKTGNYQLQVRDFDGLIIARNGSDAIFFNSLKSSQGHTHNDKLSIYPVFNGVLLFIDRGSFSYSGFWRKRHEDRMSASHNGPLLNDWEQNTIWKNDPFYNNGEAKCFSLTEHNGCLLTISGWHVGYERFRKGLKVFRQIQWNIKKRSILITDWIDGIASNEIFELKLNFLINPLWSVKVKDEGFIFGYNDQTVKFVNGESVSFGLGQGLYCPSYQVEAPCQTLSAACKVKIGEKIHFSMHY